MFQKAAVVGFLVAVASAAQGAGFPPGLNLDEKAEAALGASAARLAGLGKAKQPDLKALAREIAAARKLARPLALKVERKDVAPPPETVTVPDNAPVILPPGATAEQGRRLWQQQLRMNLRVPAALLAGEGGAVREWVGYPLNRDPRNRAWPLVEALREADKLVRLLSRDPAVTLVKKGERLFEDDFAKGAENWLQFGQCVAKNEGDAFRMKDRVPRHPDAMMWTKREFDGNFVAEFTFIPHSRGGRAGALFTICARPRPGKKLDVCVGRSMDTYNRGIDGYHFSMHRGTTGLGNVRRVGPGLKMLASGKDPCPVPGKAYKVSVGKYGPAIFLLVDGKLIHSWYDGETYGPVLTAGRIGLRHWAGMDASYKRFRVYRLIEGKGAKPVENQAKLIEPKGKVLFEESFKNLDNWRHEGGGKLLLDDKEPDTLRLNCIGSGQGKQGTQAFVLKDFPDHIAVEYDLKVLTKNGLVITFVAMAGIDGGDMFDPKQPKRQGVFSDYVRNPKLRSYHVSISRYGDKGIHTGVSNFRRNPGLNLVGQGPDLCKEISQWYRIRIVKDGPHLQLGVNGVLAHEFTDPKELKTPMPDSGKVGFRAIGKDVQALIRNLKVTALK